MSGVFKLNPGSVEGTAIAALSLDSVVSKVNSVNISDGEFDFDGAKSVILNNLESCKTVIDNTASFIDQAVESHQTLQNIVASNVNSNSDSSDGGSAGGKSSKNYSTGNSGVRSSGAGGYNAGGSSAGGSSARGTSAGGSSAGGSGISRGAASPSFAKKNIGKTATSMANIGSGAGKMNLSDFSEKLKTMSAVGSSTGAMFGMSDGIGSTLGSVGDVGASVGLSNDIVETTRDTNSLHYRDGVLMNAVENIECVSAQDVNVGDELINNIKSGSNGYSINMNVTYDNNGYAKVDNKYVISCNETLGVIGDSITIVKDNGDKVSCIIGNVTNSNDLKNNLDFVVNSDIWNENNSNNISNDLLENTADILVGNIL